MAKISKDGVCTDCPSGQFQRLESYKSCSTCPAGRHGFDQKKKVRNVQLGSVECLFVLWVLGFKFHTWWTSEEISATDRLHGMLDLSGWIPNCKTVGKSLFLQCLSESNLLFATIDCWVCGVFELPEKTGRTSFSQHLRKWVYSRWCVLWWLPAGCATCRVS